MAKNFNVTGGLGFQGYNLKDPMKKSTASTGTNTTAATRDQFYGGASTPKKPSGMVSLPGTATKMLKQKFSTKYTPGDYAAYRKALAAKKPVAKPAAQVVSNVTNAKMSPVKNSTIKKPPATRFGTVTGKTTGTRVSGGGGYGGGGTRGGGSLSGGGSGSRTAGTSRTGGTRSNDPVRG
jgi:uncharacterized membrane protein YgcG